MSRGGLLHVVLAMITAFVLASFATSHTVHADEFDCASVTDVPQSECEALVDVYTDMNGSGWLDSTDWLTSIEVCTWYGVWCGSGTNVTELYLTYNNLNGPLPTSIENLTTLTSFAVDGISGALPAEITALTTLNQLSVGGTWDNTQFTGPLPDLSVLPGLTSLTIENSTIGGSIPGWINPVDMPNLTTLSLFRNQFSGSVPAGVTDLPATYINLISNQLIGDFPDFSGACDTLDTLLLSQNNFTAGPLPAWLNGMDCPNITSLELRRTARTGTFPDLSGMPLFNLALSDNHFDSGPVPTWLLDLDGFYTLDISNTHRTGVVPEFSNTSELGFLSLYSNDFSGVIPSSYNAVNYPSLYDISFYDNQITGIADEFASFDTLGTYTSVYYNNIVPSSLHPDVLAYLDNIDWSGTPQFNWKTAQNVPPTSFTLTPNGTSVDISITNNVPLAAYFTVSYTVLASTTPGGPYTQHLALINEFDTPTVTGQANGLDPDTTYYAVIHSNVGTFFGDPMHGIIRSSVYSAEQSFITGAAASATDCANTAQTGIPQDECNALVDMYNNNGGANWTNSGNWLVGSPCAWAGITCTSGHVTAILLDDNNLTGALPDLDALDNLEQLNLSQNGLTGSFPSWLASKTSIMGIWLQGNALTGAIPDLSALTNLADLWLGNNSFSGGFPAGLANKTSLNRILLDGNDLSGSIPDLSGATALLILQVYNNDFSGTLPALPTSTIFVGAGGNKFSGTIPASYGSLTNLSGIVLTGNALEGEIPASIGDLPNLGVGVVLSAVEFGYNMLTATDLDVVDLLTEENPGFFTTQTVPPDGVAFDNVTEDSADISWTPIAYTANDGRYQIGISTTAGSGYVFSHSTADKSAAGLTLNGLTPDTTYYVVVRTVTDSHAGNSSTLTSGLSAEISFTTDEGVTPTFDCANTAQTGVPQSECEALVDLYDSTSGPDWTDKTNWLTTAAVEDWHGVVVDGGHVTEVWLPSNGMTGAFPDLNALTALTRLNLASNHFDFGAVPAWLLDFEGLELLDISNTRRDGGVPEFTNTDALESLQLYSNSFTGTIPASYNATNYPSLVDISFFHNVITGIAPEYASFDANDTFTSVFFNAIDPSTLDTAVAAYLDDVNDGWQDTQLVPVTSFTLTATGDTTAQVTVTNIPLASSNTVTYAVWGSQTAGGPYTELKQFTDNNAATVSTELTGLQPATTYYIVIRTHVGIFAGTPMHGNLLASPFSAEQSVTTDNTPVTTKPTKPALLAPDAGGVVRGTNSPTFTWNANPAGEGVTQYKLVVKNDNTGANVLNRTFPAGDICAATCVVDLGALAPTVDLKAATYNWRVTATNANGNNKSAKRKFSVAKPRKPVLSTFATTNDATPDFAWTVSADDQITGFKFKLVDNKQKTLVNTTADTSVCAGTSCAVSLETLSGSLVLKNGKYTLTITAINEIGKAKGKLSFKVAFPAPATDLAPAGNVIVPTQQPTLSWSPSADASRFIVTLKLIKNGAVKSTIKVKDIENGTQGFACAAGTCTLDLAALASPVTLKKGNYEWVVKSANPAVHPKSSTNSAKAKFKVKP